VEDKHQFASVADMYGSHYVLMQVSLEALPPRMKAGELGFGGGGTNWAAFLPRLMKASDPQ
jgi:hypothetical protein